MLGRALLDDLAVRHEGHAVGHGPGAPASPVNPNPGTVSFTPQRRVPVSIHLLEEAAALFLAARLRRAGICGCLAAVVVIVVPPSEHPTPRNRMAEKTPQSANPLKNRTV